MGKVKQFENFRILLVDDDDFIRDSMEMYFGSINYVFHTVGSAEEALLRLKEQEYDVIITDFRLPGMDGLEFLNQLVRMNNRARKAFTTAHGNPQVFAKARDLGVERIIEKPLSVEKVEEFLSQL